MKVSVLTSLIVAALGATSAMAQTQQPLTREEVKAELSRAMAAGDVERNDLNYGTWWATSPSSKNYDKSYGAAPSAGLADTGSMGAAGRGYDGAGSGMGNDPSASTSLQGSTSSSAAGTTTSFDSGASSMGAAGRSYDGSSAGGPASRADVAADRDAAMHGDRWIFNDLDGLRRLNPGENSHAGRVYKGPADAAY